jgi:hypothetical protein
MGRYINTVADLWEEWEKGLGGNLTVRELDKEWGTSWRVHDANQSDCKFFSTRMIIINEIITQQQNGILSHSKMIRLLDSKQESTGSG